MGRVRMTQNSSSPQRSNFGTLTMYKSFFKSQKKIQNISPQQVTKRKIELIVQEQEDKIYKLKEKEIKHISIDNNQMK